mmetsp:Transcript_12478/g.25673  ORF Transcript_12478/g.25673 Transcript_12478/m.25673 type:complete len:339 (-) Transcript_12478:993-2009(-)
MVSVVELRRHASAEVSVVPWRADRREHVARGGRRDVGRGVSLGVHFDLAEVDRLGEVLPHHQRTHAQHSHCVARRAALQLRNRLGNRRPEPQRLPQTRRGKREVVVVEHRRGRGLPRRTHAHVEVAVALRPLRPVLGNDQRSPSSADSERRGLARSNVRRSRCVRVHADPHRFLLCSEETDGKLDCNLLPVGADHVGAVGEIRDRSDGDDRHGAHGRRVPRAVDQVPRWMSDVDVAWGHCLVVEIVRVSPCVEGVTVARHPRVEARVEVAPAPLDGDASAGVGVRTAVRDVHRLFLPAVVFRLADRNLDGEIRRRLHAGCDVRAVKGVDFAREGRLAG